VLEEASDDKVAVPFETVADDDPVLEGLKPANP
jgi:hypothetical protein